jgi:deoxycytidine triphosphate deaminase
MRRRNMSTLSKREIKEITERWKMITPFKEEKTKYASYDLSVGDEYRLSSGDKVLELGKFSTVIIPPYEVCYILTKEKLNLPKNICALIFSRHRAVRQGFLMHPQPPIDPGYSGKLYILLHNLSDKPVHLKKGEHIASIVFFRLDESTKGYGTDEEDKYSDANSLKELIGDFSFSPALGKIQKEVESWRVNLLSRWLPLLFGVISIILMVQTILISIIIGGISLFIGLHLKW